MSSTSPFPSPSRRVCFVTGTRAEFGLMRSVLQAIGDHPALHLQLIVTGMHLDRSRGRSLDAIRRERWKVDSVVPWARGDGSETANAVATGKATAALAVELERLETDVVLVAGDRVEAFAAATAGHISGRIVAHVHGGDRALGLIDDSLRHAITKLSHVHFPATRLSAARIGQMGEDRWRIFRAGSPGLDDVKSAAVPRRALSAEFPGLVPRRFAIVLLHPQTPDPLQEGRNAEMLLRCAESTGFERIVIVYPNNDPGSDGIASCWDALKKNERLILRHDVSRPLFLGLMRESAVLMGNSSSGIIEAASFGTPVVNIGPRQAGREHGQNVFHCGFDNRAIVRLLRRIWNGGQPLRFSPKNVYGAAAGGKGGSGGKIASALAKIDLSRFKRKLIAY